MSEKQIFTFPPEAAWWRHDKRQRYRAACILHDRGKTIEQIADTLGVTHANVKSMLKLRADSEA